MNYNESAIQEAMNAARDCAMIMMENACYIQAELPNVQIGESLQSQTEKVCSALIVTKHDVISELFELDDLQKWSTVSESEIYSRLNHIFRLLWNNVTTMHELVTALNYAKKENPEIALAYVLVAESAANILNALNRTRTAVDALSGS